MKTLRLIKFTEICGINIKEDAVNDVAGAWNNVTLT
jgi:hypothetical protein